MIRANIEAEIVALGRVHVSPDLSIETKFAIGYDVGQIGRWFDAVAKHFQIRFPTMQCIRRKVPGTIPPQTFVAIDGLPAFTTQNVVNYVVNRLSNPATPIDPLWTGWITLRFDDDQSA